MTVGSLPLWIGFHVFVVAALLVDLLVLHKKDRPVRKREAAGWTIVWITFAMVFAGGVAHWFSAEKSLEFVAGYLIEKSLSVDNLFVFVVIFRAFAVPGALQHRVLFWGILGALILRAVFILAGAALLARFHWMAYVFGAILLFTAVRLLLEREGEKDPRHTVTYRLFARFVPTTDGYRDARFWVREGGRLLATPLLAVLLVVEGTDVIFAIDSIPAIFAVTDDPFIVFTSNIFAILGLRALYFLLAGLVEKFHYLKLGLAVILAYVGVKLLVSGFYEIPTGLSLGVIAGVLTIAVIASVVRARRLERAGALPHTSAASGEALTPGDGEASPAESTERSARG